MPLFHRPASEKARAAWEKTRRKGMLAYVVSRGLIGFGLGVGSLWMLVMFLVSPSFDLVDTGSQALRTFSLGGIFWGLSLWSLNELRYRRRQ